MEMIPYFSEPGNKNVFLIFIKKIKEFEPSDTSSLIPDLVSHLIQLFDIFVTNSEKCDRLCPSNIAWVGKEFLNRVTLFNSKSSDTDVILLGIFVIAYRFLLEIDFSQAGELSVELQQIKRWANNEFEKFPEDIRQSLVWANYFMPAAIVKNLVYHPNIEIFREYNITATSAKNLREEWVKEIEEKRQAVNILKQDLDKYEAAYNFVGLVDGFRKLLQEKHNERDFAFGSLIGIGFLILFPLWLELYVIISFIQKNIGLLDSIKKIVLFIIPTTIAIEVILFYFFRVVLIHFRTVKAHILQLDLRVSLCQFIQSYAKYSADIKKSDPASLEKFESLIFSGIVSLDEKLPSTLDGFDQLSSLVKAVREK
jgi:uncharacterized membrane protein